MGDYLLELHNIWTDIYEQLIKQVEANKYQAKKASRKSSIGPRDNILLSIKHLKLKARPGKLQP